MPWLPILVLWRAPISFKQRSNPFFFYLFIRSYEKSKIFWYILQPLLGVIHKYFIFDNFLLCLLLNNLKTMRYSCISFINQVLRVWEHAFVSVKKSVCLFLEICTFMSRIFWYIKMFIFKRHRIWNKNRHKQYVLKIFLNANCLLNKKYMLSLT